MRRLLVFGLGFFITTLTLILLPPPAAVAAGWEWRQADWTGGPGQAAWYDSSRYDSSDLVDTMSVPGTMRLSHLSHQYARDASNPVVAPGAPGAWDSNNAYGYPLRRDGGYEMLYQGGDAGGISALGYASSDNGITWIKDAANPVLERSGPAPAWDSGGVSAGPILDEGDHFTMLFSGYDTAYTHRYGLATSPTLKSWARTTGFVFEPGAPTSWEASIDDVTMVQEGGGYRLWYMGFDNISTFQLGTATSDDGITWIRDATNPVLGPGTAVDWDAQGIGTFSILERPWAGDYMMAYTASDVVGNLGIGLAFSPDGITWTKYAGNPVMGPGGPGSWNENGIYVLSLTFDGGIYKMIIQGDDAAPNHSLGEIYSTDGLMWFENPFGNPTLPDSVGPAWDDFGTFSMDIFMESGNTLRAFYNAYGGVYPYRGMGTATAAPGYPAVGSLMSSVFDAGQPVNWGSVTWDEEVPAGCAVGMYVRTGDVPVPDVTWSVWSLVANGTAVPGAGSRFIQYQVQFNGTGNDTPVVSNVAIDLTALPVTWYFAEGYTGPGFDEWITIQNPMGADAHVWVTYYTPSGAPELRPHTVPANSRYNIYVNSDLGEGLDNSFKVESDIPIVCERPMYFRYVPGVRDWEGGSDAMGSTQLSRQWYFAEGCTAESFDEYLTIQNPNPDWAIVDVTYFVNGGQPIHRQHRVAPTSRYTILVDDDAGPNLEVSAMLQADQPILAERPMYFDLMGMDGGHIVMGSAYLDRDWYLAEGATYDPFSEYITIQNPNDAAAAVAVEYQTPAGVPITTNHTIDADSRYTINARTDCGVDAEVSTYVHSNLPVLVERPMYFNMLHGGLPGGHCATGVNSPSTEWFFGEGYTGPGFDTFITVQNPGGTAANLIVIYYVSGGPPITKAHTVAPHSRYTIGVGQDAGEGLDVSTYVLSDQPVICERPMYFFYQGYHAYNWAGGHDSQGFAP
jgi:hypothetical protein